MLRVGRNTKGPEAIYEHPTLIVKLFHFHIRRTLIEKKFLLTFIKFNFYKRIQILLASFIFSYYKIILANNTNVVVASDFNLK